MTETEIRDLLRRVSDLESIVGDIRRGRIEADLILLGSGTAPTVTIAFSTAGQSRWDESSATPDTDAPESWSKPTGPRIEAGASASGGIAVLHGGSDIPDVYLGPSDVTIDGSLAGTSFTFLDAAGDLIALEASPLIIGLRNLFLNPGVTNPLDYDLTDDQTGFSMTVAPGKGPLRLLFGRKKRATVE